MCVMVEPRAVVEVGAVQVALNGTVTAVGLGSCVAIVLYDADAGIGGLAHALLPDSSCARAGGRIGRFAAEAVPALIEAMEEAGAARERMYARLVGGASMFEGLLSGDGPGLGRRNVAAARQALAEAGIPVRGEEVGGSRGRSVRLEVADGSVVVTSVMQSDVEL